MASLMSILKKAGFTGNGLKMAYAIAMAESGGRASAHNGNASTGDNSYGLFQINMLGAMGPDRRKRYGLSSNDDLYDPLTNAKVAYAMSNGGRNWGPWSTYNSGAYKAYYGGSTADVTGGGGGSDTVTPKLSSDELASQYGLTSALINSSSELKSLFKKAVAGSWTADLFQAHLKNTTWWKTQSDTLRQYITQKYTDPASWKQANANKLAAVQAMAVSIGLRSGTWTNTLNKMVYNSLALGWSDDQIKNYLGGLVNSHDGEMYGEAGQNFDQMRQLAYENGVNHSLKWFRDRTQEVTGGRSTMEAVEASIRNTAAAKYSAFADQIKAGQNALDLAAPYVQSVAKILEVPQTEIGLDNSHVMRAMTTNKGGQAMSIWDFENKLRQDPVWRKTQNAQDSLMGTAHQVLQQFGLAF